MGWTQDRAAILESLYSYRFQVKSEQALKEGRPQARHRGLS